MSFSKAVKIMSENDLFYIDDKPLFLSILCYTIDQLIDGNFKVSINYFYDWKQIDQVLTHIPPRHVASQHAGLHHMKSRHILPKSQGIALRLQRQFRDNNLLWHTSVQIIAG